MARRTGPSVGRLFVVPYLLLALILPASLLIEGPLVGVIFVALQLTGLVMSITAARIAGRNRAARAWWLVAFGFVLLILTGVAFGRSGVTESTESITAGRQNWLLAAISLRAAFGLVMLASLLSLSTGARAAGSRWRLGLDTTTVLGGGLMFTWYFIVGPVVSRSGTLSSATYAYALVPLVDLLLVIGVSDVLLRGSGPAGRRPLLLLLTGAVVFSSADVLFALLALHPDLSLAVDLRVLVQLVPQMFVVAAATEQCRAGSAASVDELGERSLRPVTWLPYLALVIGFGLLAVAARDALYPWIGLVAGAILMTASVATRQFLALRENRAMAATDALTGLANRIRLREVLAELEITHRRSEREFAVLVIDLDDFKPVNDTLGHEAGDALLVGFAGMLRRVLPPGGTAARLGGDEFAVVVPGIGAVADATRVAERVVQALEAPFDVFGHRVRVRASIGVAASIGLSSATDLPHRADLAMYEAKGSPASRWRLHVPGGVGGLDLRSERMTLRSEIVDAVRDGRLSVFYQPVVELVGGAVVGAEALVRWPHPTRGLMLPRDLLPLAEEAGMMPALDLWVLGEACRQVSAWRRLPQACELRLTAHLSARRLVEQGTDTAILGLLDDVGLDPHDLTLELVGTGLTATEAGRAQVERVRDAGVRIALDGVGAAALPLDHLMRMRPDVIKVDLAVLAGLPPVSAAAIARAITQLARESSVEAVAVGVETPEHVQLVMDLDFTHGQGHHFTRPLPPAELAPIFGQVLLGGVAHVDPGARFEADPDRTGAVRRSSGSTSSGG